MTLRFNNDLRDMFVQAIADWIDADGAGATVRYYDGEQPARGDPPTGTLLAELTLSYPCGTVLDQALTMDTITSDSSADATGQVAWARISTAADVFCFDAGVYTDTSGGAIIIVNTTSVVASAPVAITTMVLRAPN